MWKSLPFAIAALVLTGCTVLEPTDSLQRELLASRPLYPSPELDLVAGNGEDGKPDLIARLVIPRSPDCCGYGDDAVSEPMPGDVVLFLDGLRPCPPEIQQFAETNAEVGRAQAFMESHGFRCERFEPDEGRGLLYAKCKRYVPPVLSEGKGWRIERCQVEFFYHEGRVREASVYGSKQTLWNAFLYDVGSTLPSWLYSPVMRCTE